MEPVPPGFPDLVRAFVEKRLEHIYHELGVESRTEAVSRALEIFGLV